MTKNTLLRLDEYFWMKILFHNFDLHFPKLVDLDFPDFFFLYSYSTVESVCESIFLEIFFVLQLYLLEYTLVYKI